MVPRIAAGLLLLLLPLLSGCLGGGFLQSREGFTEWTALPCDPTKQDERSVVRGKDPSPLGDMNALARRFGEALEDPVLTKNPTLDPDGRSEWKTAHGTIRTRHAIDEATLLEYEARRAWPGSDLSSGKAALERFATRFEFPGSWIVNYTSREAGEFEGKVRQSLDGRLVGTMATEIWFVDRGQVGGAFVKMNLRPFWLLPTGERDVNEAKALQIAQAFQRCNLDQADRTQARGYEHRYTGLLFDWMPVHNQTVSYAITSKYHNPFGGKCPSEKTEATIYIDAWTGAVLTWDWNRCSSLA